jgi:phosphohistidine phosphatase
MRLYLVQHGDALPRDIDPDRPLSERGRADIARLAEWLSGRNVGVARILHSGKARARETAELLLPLVQSDKHIYESQGLLPNDSPEAFLRRLSDPNEDTLVASHMPFVARTVSQALTHAPDRRLIEFLPGSIAGLERKQGASWHLFLFARPEVLPGSPC